MMYGYGMGPWIIAGWIIMAIVIVFAMYGLIVLIRKTESGVFTGKTQKPIDILKERLARGEIDSDEYYRIKEELLK